MEIRQPQRDRLNAIRASMKRKSTTELWSVFKGCLLRMQDLLEELACVVAELVERGEQVDHRCRAMCLQIAEGRLLPEAAAMFLESDNLEFVANLPIKDQAQLVADDGHAPLVIPATSGGTTTVMVDFRTVKKHVAKSLCKPSGLVTAEQQEAEMKLDRLAPAARARLAPAELRAEKRVYPVPGKLTESELVALRYHADRKGMTTEEFVHYVLARSRVLKKTTGRKNSLV